MVLNLLKKLRINTGIILAIIAIFLTQTQFRPFYTLLDKPRIETNIDLHSLWINHNFGHLLFEQYLQIRNSGNSPQTISKIYYYIEKVRSNTSSNFEGLTTVQTRFNYNERTSSGENFIQYPVFDIYLKPGDAFSYPVMIYETLTKSQQQKLGALSQEIKRQIEENHPFWSSSIVGKAQISDSLQKIVNSEINTNLQNFTIGEYNLLVIPFDKNNKPISQDKCYSFTIFDSDIEKLNETSKAYKFGGNGIYYFVKNQDNGFTTTLTANYDKNLIQLLLLRSQPYWSNY